MDVWDTSSLPLGFGFHPTDVELISHYLKRKVLGLNNEIEVIPEVDIYKHEPWELPGKTRIVSRDCKWHFFNTLDRKYPTGSRSNRATEAGYWKSTGKDRVIRSHARVVGTKKTLVFHQGRPPHGKRSDWIMHEFFLDENERKSASARAKDVFVLCRITKRNSAEPEDREETSDTCALPRMLKDTQTDEQVVENSSAEDVNCEAWVQELYDPDFRALPIPTTCKIEMDEMNSNSLAPISELESSFLPLNVENMSSVNEESYYYQDYGTSLYEELCYFAQLEEDARMGAQLRETQLFTSSADEYSIDKTIDTGIHIRDNPTRNFDENSKNGIKLQAHKMAQKNTEAMSHTVILENSNCHLDVSDLSEPVILYKNAAYHDHGIHRTKEERILEEPEVRDQTTRRFRACVKSLIRKTLKDAHVLTRKHSPISRKNMRIGGCLTGFAVVAGLMMEEKA